MSSEFADYRVLNVLDRGNRVVYRVEDKTSGIIYVWEPVDYSLVSKSFKNLVRKEIKLIQEITNQNLIRCFNHVDHRSSCTLYLVKEFCAGNVAALIRKCKSTNSFIDEAFVWRILYQTARVIHAVYVKGTSAIVLDVSPTGLQLDDDGNVRLDYSLVFNEVEMRNQSSCDSTSSRDESEVTKKKRDTWCLGLVVQELASLQPAQGHPHKQPRLPPHFSEDLQKILDIMLSPDVERRPTIEGILYHPALVSHIVAGSFQQLTVSNNPHTSSSESSLEVCEKCKESEHKLAVIRKREAALKNKEQELKEKERSLENKEKHVLLQQRLAKEKMTRAEIYLGQGRRIRGVPNSNRIPDNLDSSSYSADTGDTSLLPTMAKIDPSRIHRPPSLASSTSSRRSVRFETIPELMETDTLNNERFTWLENKRIRYKASKKKGKRIFSKQGKENQPPSTPTNLKFESIGKDISRKSSIVSLVHNTKETKEGVLETFFH